MTNLAAEKKVVRSATFAGTCRIFYTASPWVARGCPLIRNVKIKTKGFVQGPLAYSWLHLGVL